MRPRSAGLMKSQSTLHDITLTGGGTAYSIVAATPGGGGSSGGGGGGGNPTPPAPVGPTTVTCSDAGSPAVVAGFSAVCYGDQSMIGNTVLVISHSPHIRGALADFVTIRNDRFVVPVVSGKQRSVQGVIHGSSASGHTLFVDGGYTAR